VIVLIIPVAALALALMWVRWARQPEKPLDPAAQIAAHHRTLDALAPETITLPDSEQRPRTRMPSLH
jgi:hypothetical protein